MNDLIVAKESTEDDETWLYGDTKEVDHKEGKEERHLDKESEVKNEEIDGNLKREENIDSNIQKTLTLEEPRIAEDEIDEAPQPTVLENGDIMEDNPIANQVDEHDDEEDEDDDVQVTIRDIKATPSQYNYGFKGVPFNKSTGHLGGNLSKVGLLDIDEMGTFNNIPLVDVNLEDLEDKPWRKPGADITDYFNYGFNEESWRIYCERQKLLRGQNIINPVQGIPILNFNDQFKPPIYNPVPYSMHNGEESKPHEFHGTDDEIKPNDNDSPKKTPSCDDKSHPSYQVSGGPLTLAPPQLAGAALYHPHLPTTFDPSVPPPAIPPPISGAPLGAIPNIPPPGYLPPTFLADGRYGLPPIPHPYLPPPLGLPPPHASRHPYYYDLPPPASHPHPHDPPSSYRGERRSGGGRYSRSRSPPPHRGGRSRYEYHPYPPSHSRPLHPYDGESPPRPTPRDDDGRGEAGEEADNRRERASPSGPPLEGRDDEKADDGLPLRHKGRNYDSGSYRSSKDRSRHHYHHGSSGGGGGGYSKYHAGDPYATGYPSGGVSSRPPRDSSTRYYDRKDGGSGRHHYSSRRYYEEAMPGGGSASGSSRRRSKHSSRSRRRHRSRSRSSKYSRRKSSRKEAFEREFQSPTGKEFIEESNENTVSKLPPKFIPAYQDEETNDGNANNKNSGDGKQDMLEEKKKRKRVSPASQAPSSRNSRHGSSSSNRSTANSYHSSTPGFKKRHRRSRKSEKKSKRHESRASKKLENSASPSQSNYSGEK